MSEDIKKGAIDFLKKAGKVTSEAINIAKEEYGKSELKSAVDEKTKDVKDYLDETGVTEKVSDLSNVATDHLDKVSGKKILDLVEERLGMQNEYNDVLAHKLEEALKRIDVLEKKIKKI